MSWFKGRLRGALAQVDQPCPFCDNAVVYVKWDAERRRHRVKMVHPTATCPALGFNKRSLPNAPGACPRSALEHSHPPAPHPDLDRGQREGHQ